MLFQPISWKICFQIRNFGTFNLEFPIHCTMSFQVFRFLSKSEFESLASSQSTYTLTRTIAGPNLQSPILISVKNENNQSNSLKFLNLRSI